MTESTRRKGSNHAKLYFEIPQQDMAGVTRHHVKCLDGVFESHDILKKIIGRTKSFCFLFDTPGKRAA